MKQQQVDKILEYVRHAPGNERLMELSLGCEVQQYGMNVESNHWTVIWKKDKEVQCARGWLDGSIEYRWFDDDMFKKIIGHPVQWANVLVAMGGLYSIDGDGMIWKYTHQSPFWRSIPLTVSLSTLPAEELLTNDEAREFLLELFNLNDHGSN